MNFANPGASIYLLFKYAILAPLAEEVFFRGWLWTGLRKRPLSALGTAMVTGGLWLGLHAAVRVDLPLGILPSAIILSLARHFGESVRASIALHAVYNCVLLASVWLLTNGLL